jgi:hypothetical protein
MALDLAGGVIANATTAAKRWYHRDGQRWWDHIGFVAVHLYPFLVAWLFRGGDWGYALLTYGFLLLAAGAIVAVPLYLQRATALALYMAGLTLALVVVVPTPGLAWFLPLLYLKLLVSHLVREAPFRPNPTNKTGIPPA